MLPRVSVIIPAFNAEKYLRDAVESVRAQSVPGVEIVVVDDGSHDGTKDVAEKISGVRCIRQPNRGAGAARNTGIGLTRAPLVAFLDADDLWEPRKLERQLAILDEQPAPDLVFGYTIQFLSPDARATSPALAAISPAPVPGWLPSTLLVRREIFARIGFFPTELVVGEFIDWFARAREQGANVTMLPEVVHRRRIHGANLGVVRRDALPDYARLLKASLDRRRAKGLL